MKKVNEEEYIYDPNGENEHTISIEAHDDKIQWVKVYSSRGEGSIIPEDGLSVRIASRNVDMLHNLMQELFELIL